MKNILFLLMLIIIFFVSTILSSCNDSSSSDTTTSSSSSSDTSVTTSSVPENFPTGLSVSSPTSVSSTSSKIVKISSGDSGNSFQSTRTRQEKSTYLNQIAGATSASSCQISLPTDMGSIPADCYGPEIYYMNHPDGASNGGCDNTAQACQMPTGDLGIWTATDTDGTACIAKKLNNLTTSISNKLDKALLLIAGVTCLINTSDTLALPTEGATTDVTTEFNSAVQANNSSSEVYSATISRLPDYNSKKVYKTYIKYKTVESETTVYGAVTLWHSPQNDDNSEYMGKMAGYVSGFADQSGGSAPCNQDHTKAFSLVYSKSSSEIKYKLSNGGFCPNNTYNSSTNESTAVNSSGDLDLTNVGGDLNHFVANFDPSTNVGNYKYIWLAGSNTSEKTRVFNLYINDSGQSGCGFYGFGDDYSNGVPDGSIKNFYCNWTTPGARTAQSGKGQKQCFTKNTSSGIYETVTSKDKTTYSPTASCDYDGNGSFSLGTSSSSLSAASSTTNDLITVSTDSDFSNYTSPSNPDDIVSLMSN